MLQTGCTTLLQASPEVALKERKNIEQNYLKIRRMQILNQILERTNVHYNAGTKWQLLSWFSLELFPGLGGQLFDGSH